MMQRITAIISHIGYEGDGIARTDDGLVAVPFTLPGEEVDIEILDNVRPHRVQLHGIITPSQRRVKSPCPSFGACGGCRMQHLADDYYQSWKTEITEYQLKKHGLDTKVTKTFITPPASRRRVTFSAIKTQAGLEFGFYGRAQHSLVTITECPVIKPQLQKLIEPLKAILAKVLPTDKSAEIQLTALNGAVEMIVRDISISDADAVLLVNWAAAHGISRLLVQESKNEAYRIILNQQLIAANYNGHEVILPPAPFMQASDEAEAEMVATVTSFLKPTKRMADLFCGTGLFALNLWDKTKTMLAVDVDGAAIETLEKTAKKLAHFKTVRRNLFREPLSAHELSSLDGVCLDPPRAGAKEQAQTLAASSIKRIAYVSCNPASFMRDARLLVDGGYKLENVEMFDQFLWSHHVELIGLFVR